MTARMRAAFVQAFGVALTLVYGSAIVWVYATQPRTFREVATGAQVATGTYEVDAARFATARDLFRREQFRPAREEWERADPARRDPRTQFYIAYACYREGWGRLHHDDTLYRQGLDAVDRAIALVPQGSLRVDDPDLQMKTAAELRAELSRGLETSWSDFNPLRVMERRK
jgi:hypothetical protein